MNAPREVRYPDFSCGYSPAEEAAREIRAEDRAASFFFAGCAVGGCLVGLIATGGWLLGVIWRLFT